MGVSVLALAAALTALSIVIVERLPDEPSPVADEAPAIPPAEPAAPRPEAPLGDLSPSAGTADVVAHCLPAVVNISSRRVTQEPGGPSGNPFFDLLRPFLGGGGPRESQSLGSGVIVDPAGVVLTNHHVVAEATEIRVTLSDGRELAARSVGSDPESDIAVLRIDPEDGLALSALPYGDSTALRQGDSVLAIGNPFGVGQTVTMGIVSAIGRASMGITDYEDFIQTDAAINPGNSGGALVNSRGQLVGINTAILSRTGGSHGIGFAIPSNMARPIAEALLRDGHVTRGWLGVALQDLNPQLARSIGLAPGARGVALMDVEPAGPAAGVDLARGDVITRLDAETIHSSRQLRNLLATRGAGTEVRLTRARGGAEGVVTVTLAERPVLRAEAAPAGEVTGGAEVAGLTLAPMSDPLRSRYSIATDVTGVVVVATGQGPGPSAGMQVGDVIVDVGGQTVETPEQFRAAFEGSFFVAMVRVRRGDATRMFFVGR
ncbi:MAG: Do family serine endopeptidase [Sandaracinaceae bacterium]|nr:Do family serine endopeptidase [Sandaracinaceae bacterium]